LIPSAPCNNTPLGIRLSGHNPFNFMIFSLSYLRTVCIFIILETKEIFDLVISIYFLVICWNFPEGRLLDKDYPYVYYPIITLAFGISSSESSIFSPGLGYKT